MAGVEDINEVDLLSNIKNRFYKQEIFTNVGKTLIIVNPYQNFPGVFGEDIIEKFQDVNKNIFINAILLLELQNIQRRRKKRNRETSYL